MTVKEFIEKLKAVPEDLVIKTQQPYGGAYPEDMDYVTVTEENDVECGHYVAINL